MIKLFKVTGIIFLLFGPLLTSGQNKTLQEAKKGDFAIFTGKRFNVVLDNGETWSQRRIYTFFYVDSVVKNNSNTLDKVHLTDGEDVQFTVNFSDTTPNYYDKLSLSTYMMVCDTCDPKGYYVKYICNDSLSIGSTHPSRPFIYGYNYTKEQCKKSIPDIEFMGLKPGQYVAGIGAASGWYEGALSVYTENIHFTIQDINPKVLNQKQFNAVVKHFSSVRETSQTNTFDFVLGTMDSTCLPRNKYDKIIVRNAYHEFTDKWKMVHDLKTKLTPEGEIILMDESFSSFYYTNYHSGCDIRALQAKDVIRFFNQQGLYLVKMDLPLNAFENQLIFSQNKKKSEEYLNSLKPVNEIIFKVDRLNTSIYASNEEYIEEVHQLLKTRLNEIHATYDSLNYYLTDIGGNWTETENYEYALPILTMCDELYPDIAYTQFYLGITYYGLWERHIGDTYFAKAIKLDKSREKDIEAFKKYWIEWWGEE